MKLSGKNLRKQAQACEHSRSPTRKYLKRIYLFGPQTAPLTKVAALIGRHGDFEVCGACSEFTELLGGLDKSGADLVLFDADTRGPSASSGIRTLKSKNPSLRVLAVSDNDHAAFAAQLLDVGADGYVLKDAGAEEIVAATCDVASGHVYLSEELLINPAGDTNASGGLGRAFGTIVSGSQN